MKETETSQIIEKELCRILDSAQRNGSLHHRLVIELRKIQENKRTDNGIGEVQEFEAIFSEEFIKKLNFVLAVKKKEPSVERILKFVVAFIHYGYKKEDEAVPNTVNMMDTDDVFEDEPSTELTNQDGTLTSRFTEELILHLLHGFLAKEKMVRLRCCQLVSMLVVLLKDIDEDLYEELVNLLEKRLLDKEAGVRANAAIALCRLLNGDQMGNVKSLKKLSSMMKSEPNSEVRRAIMLGIDINPSTLPNLLERARDKDAINRKVLYGKVLSKVDYRILSIEKREELLISGIRDRDVGVQQACVQLIATCWLKDADYNLVSLFEGLDVVDSEIADETIKALLNSYPEIAEKIEFSSKVWEDLQPESSFLLRHTLEYYREKNDVSGLEERLPETLEIVKLIRKQLESRSSSDDRDGANRLEDEHDIEIADAEIDYIILQLLIISKNLDFLDELGRREMLTLMRKLLVIPDISEQHIGHIMDILRKLSLDETDFTQITVEVISGVQQNGEEALLIVSREELKAVKLLTQLKSLHIIKALLQRCYLSLSEHSPVYALTHEFVSPALSQNEPALLKCAVDCLALCSLLDKKMAVGNAGLLVAVCQQGVEEYKINGLQALFDISFIFGIDEISENLKKDELATVFMSALESENGEIQALAAQGLAKLLYGGRIPNASLVLHNLAVMYFHILTVDNLNLRQCLSYFFPAYCLSLSSNQREMAKAVVPIFIEYSSCYYLEWKGKVSDTVYQTTSQITQQLFSWTDPRIRIEFEKNIGSQSNDSSLTHDLVWFFEIGVDALLAANNYCKNINEDSDVSIIVLIIRGLINLTMKLDLENVPKTGIDSTDLSYKSEETEKALTFVYEKLFILSRCLRLSCATNFGSDLVIKRGIEKLEAIMFKILKTSRYGYSANEILKDLLRNQQLKIIFDSFVMDLERNTNGETNPVLGDILPVSESFSNLENEEVPVDSDEDAIITVKSEIEKDLDGVEAIDEGKDFSETVEEIKDQNDKLKKISENMSIVKKNGILKPKKSRKSIDINSKRPYPSKILFDPKSELDTVRQQIDDILLDEE
ncbi:Condensin complex subunit 3 [Smittium mucronatum]|uniref:Condensin complex subunit 3 n=1 Tax=Smittium mucronatum TaxID=133383 RepID=A0A1R0GV33_9FUNG|nr:Condensin complex subunit 3 [Smittium mucronatum]